MVTLRHVITVYYDMIDYMDGVKQALARKRTEWKEDMFFPGKFVRHQLSQ